MPKIIAPSFYFIGNHLALDFLNTKVVSAGNLVDLLQTSNDVLNWLVQAGSLTAEQMNAVNAMWREGNTLVQEAVELRTGIRTLVRQGMQGEDAADEDMERVNRILRGKAVTVRLVQHHRRFASIRHTELRHPVDLLIPVAEAAVDLLVNVDLGLVKKCGNPDCVLYFYDNSKNNTRRWCSQKTCGNRMKVAAYLERKKREEKNRM
ncbi:Conserved protein containing a Zn-ribbon-like motif, possibly RNA-binding [Chlamydia abortus]|uniref:CGNR zinc finger domain-containing protein n=1 Tax=Paenibacillus residui TaxID=629724 RepID=A0ABW3D773_9BACL|nr:ABATE domain-containing protein [Paenibacillus sp. 32O-W]SHE10772.1 Conserved protein containing a Zn-ribbon-like motif, possibly RNA-binding [Chlamydia abortus]